MDKKIQDALKQFVGTVYYDNAGGYIWGTNQKNDGVQMIAQVPEIRENESLVSIRGWGAIQNMKLPCTAEQFQDEIGKFVAEAINEKLAKL